MLLDAADYHVLQELHAGKAAGTAEAWGWGSCVCSWSEAVGRWVLALQEPARQAHQHMSTRKKTPILLKCFSCIPY